MFQSKYTSIAYKKILNRYKTTPRLWLVTRDSDFFLEREGKSFLNPFLYRELLRIGGSTTEVFCFSTIEEGVSHFVREAGVDTKAVLSQEESREIRDEWSAANNIVRTSTSALNAEEVVRWRDSHLKTGARSPMPFFLAGNQSTVPPLTSDDKKTESTE